MNTDEFFTYSFFQIDGAGIARSRHYGDKTVEVLSEPCPFCEKKQLIEINHNGYRIVTCNNFHCKKFRERLEIRKNLPAPIPEKKYSSQTLRPGYQEYLQRKVDNYWLLRRAGLSSREAGLNCSNKRTEEILAKIGKYC